MATKSAKECQTSQAGATRAANFVHSDKPFKPDILKSWHTAQQRHRVPETRLVGGRTSAHFSCIWEALGRWGALEPRCTGCNPRFIQPALFPTLMYSIGLRARYGLKALLGPHEETRLRGPDCDKAARLRFQVVAPGGVWTPPQAFSLIPHSM